ncbi:MAG: helix-turn-helix domain-containing protein [Trichlorobacter sp.]|uniref:helix-turn-helix domain-containing protein n=1 Tax=Trichlorobacter sp. TaxID=2911007 RepID=UPI00256C1820|nr:helix-turn-helix transcriptional regulator [Trichlorobacter sp.]MDK9716699.1 helix-turn-helix domain-containing protein [Trichlorobacter sp.]
MQKFKTIEELEEQLGQQIRNLRILRNLAQSELAERAGVALNAVKRLESGQTSTTKSLVKVLKALNRTEWLGTLAPQVTVNPLQQVRLKLPGKRCSDQGSLLRNERNGDNGACDNRPAIRTHHDEKLCINQSKK